MIWATINQFLLTRDETHPNPEAVDANPFQGSYSISTGINQRTMPEPGFVPLEVSAELAILSALCG